MVTEEAVEIIFKLCTHFLDPPPHDMQTIHFIIFFRAVFTYLFSACNTLHRGRSHGGGDHFSANTRFCKNCNFLLRNKIFLYQTASKCYKYYLQQKYPKTTN